MVRLLVAFVFFCMSGWGTAQATLYNVVSQDFEFVPQLLTISLGDTVVWTNVQGTHNVLEACGDPLFLNSVQEAPWVFQFVFSEANGVTPGTFPYVCEVHPDIMWGAITVARPPRNFFVEVTDFVFAPSQWNVYTGDTVTWLRLAGFHNVHHNSATPLFHNDPSDTWTTYVWTVDAEIGAYPYICEIHPETMLGVINVIGPNPAPPPPAGLTAKGTATGSDVVLRWSSSPGATCYLIYRSPIMTTNPFTQLVTMTTDTSITLFGIAATQSRSFFTVQAISD